MFVGVDEQLPRHVGLAPQVKKIEKADVYLGVNNLVCPQFLPATPQYMKVRLGQAQGVQGYDLFSGCFKSRTIYLIASTMICLSHISQHYLSQ